MGGCEGREAGAEGKGKQSRDPQRKGITFCGKSWANFPVFLLLLFACFTTRDSRIRSQGSEGRASVTSTRDERRASAAKQATASLRLQTSKAQQQRVIHHLSTSSRELESRIQRQMIAFASLFHPKLRSTRVAAALRISCRGSVFAASRETLSREENGKRIKETQQISSRVTSTHTHRQRRQSLTGNLLKKRILIFFSNENLA